VAAPSAVDAEPYERTLNAPADRTGRSRVRIRTRSCPAIRWKDEDVTATFVFDGDCAFCTACANWLTRNVHTDARIVPWQRADLARLGLTRAQCQQAVQWIADGRTSAGPAAIADLLRTATGRGGRLWRAVGPTLGTAPVLALAWPAYRWVARHRHQLPGGSAACALPASPAGQASLHP
jgi:predicted DCC family thiol-disulfide oxidoreductase YuxK